MKKNMSGKKKKHGKQKKTQKTNCLTEDIKSSHNNQIDFYLMAKIHCEYQEDDKLDIYKFY